MGKIVEKGIAFGVAFLILQTIYGTIQTPSSFTFQSVLAVAMVLVLYLFLTFRSPIAVKKLNPTLLKTSLVFGLIISLIYATQIISEYFISVTGKIDEVWGYIAFGGLPLWFGLSGALSTFKTKNFRSGLISAIWSAMISSLIWINVLFLMYFIFFNTSQEYAVLKAGETIADFQRSGMNDLHSFVIQDYMGATFFHLLLSVIAAIIFGSVGSLVAKSLPNKTSVHKPKL